MIKNTNIVQSCYNNDFSEEKVNLLSSDDINGSVQKHVEMKFVFNC